MRDSIRDWRINKAYNYPGWLSMSNEEYSKKAIGFLEEELKEDMQGLKLVRNGGDATSEALFQKGKIVTAYIKAKQSGVIAGLEEISLFYQNHGLEINRCKNDGEKIKKGEKVMEIKGDIKTILELERTGLNLLQRMSGVATATRNLKDGINGYGTEIVATRKTQLRYLDKKAVMLGGGMTHRLGLYDGIMIKDTHLDALKDQGVKETIEAAIELATKNENPDVKFIEIEVSNLKEAVRAAKKFEEVTQSAAQKFFEDPNLSDREKQDYIHPSNYIIMLDNMSPSEIKKVISKLKKERTYDSVLLEASGMIDENNIKKYANSGIDVISMGCITHSVKALDLSQKIVWGEK